MPGPSLTRTAAHAPLGRSFDPPRTAMIIKPIQLNQLRDGDSAVMSPQRNSLPSTPRITDNHVAGAPKGLHHPGTSGRVRDRKSIVHLSSRN